MKRSDIYKLAQIAVIESQNLYREEKMAVIAELLEQGELAKLLEECMEVEKANETI